MCERPPSMIMSLRKPTGEMLLGQTGVNLLLQGHLKGMYSTPERKDSHSLCEYLDGLQLSKLMEVQAEELEGDVKLEEQQEALRAIPCRKSLGPDGLPAVFYRAQSASVLPGLLETLCKAHREGKILGRRDKGDKRKDGRDGKRNEKQRRMGRMMGRKA
ncbi:hypothetical protein NDU88_004676 [Pleurodeles waltl]|uniref:Uncharacterized protein n=1 Tax=Pleurodeles waltl TaxID=8319 RepID=A0AAV7T8G6_PLEWA|nr:hypothetical protein NDU88_004676 [Pleurodeles waltl]